MKKVIFVGGAEYSGSTFFHMILANDDHGLAVGEAHNFMRPSRPYHFRMDCSCGENPCSVWQQLKEAGEERLYQTLFTMFPDLDFIVDSSGNPFWIQDQKAYLAQQGIAAEDILIWKSPFEFAQSHFKRGTLDSWERSWTVYHRLYSTLFERWPAIPYSALVKDREALAAVCSELGIEDFEGKERYWERTHHVVGGNPSARVHLYPQDSLDFEKNVQRSSSRIEVEKTGTHRSIYYEKGIDSEVERNVNAIMDENPQVEAILDLLEERDVREIADREIIVEAPLRMPPLFVQLRRVKYRLVRRRAKSRYG